MGEIEKQMTEEEMQLWIESADRSQFVCATIMIGFFWLAASATPTLMYWLYIKPENARLSITYMDAPNYIRAWYSMWMGHLLAFAPSAVLFWPAYFSTTAARWYYWFGDYGMLMAQGVGMWVMLLFVVAAIETGLEQAATKSIWISMVLYVVINVFISAIFVKFEKQAKLFYMWPLMEAMVEGGDFDELDELDDTATELLATF